MLKATTKDGNVSIKASGALKDLLVDTLQIINAVYDSLYSECNKGCAQEYRRMMIKAITSSKSGVWSTSDSDGSDAQPVEQDEEPTIKIGELDLDGCESGEDAAKALVSLLRSMGVPVPKDDTEKQS